MVFHETFQTLREVFPDIDLRILKAVAIEHYRDVDAACEFVLQEVLPLCEPQKEPDTVRYSQMNGSSSSREIDLKGKSISSGHEEVHANPSPVSEPQCEDVAGSDIKDDALCLNSPQWDAAVANGSASAPSSVDHENFLDTCLLHGSLPPAELEEHQKTDSIIGSCFASYSERRDIASPIHEDPSLILGNALAQDQSFSVPLADQQDLSGVEGTPHTTAVCCDERNFCPSLDNNLSKEGISSVNFQNILSMDPIKVDSTEHGLQPEDHIDTQSLEILPDLLISLPPVQKNSNFEAQPGHVEGCSELLIEQLDLNTSIADCNVQGCTNLIENEGEQLDLNHEVDKFEGSPLVTRSGYNVDIESFEDSIKDAKSNKIMMLSAMESVMSMMKEVELKENKAKHAKEEALNAGQVILKKVEEMKNMLKDEKEKNDLHCGSVYGERAILATEARELQSRLLNLSAQRDYSLSMIGEMQQGLAARLAAAEAEIAAAEHEKSVKEESAMKVLAEHQLLIDMVTQEAVKLKEEEEENNKLREFLIDRGRIVDALQGEIAVVCEDVKSLKVKIDERFPLYSSIQLVHINGSLSSSSASHSVQSEEVSQHSDIMSSSGMVSQEKPVREEFANGESVDKVVVVSEPKVSPEDEWVFFEMEA
ncbi:hypothetical protein QJS10_CPB17g01929 [Acorus calamus]|uniref:CUE domain-containing protein n=1 Tax=Acorus calamus TaxID=4465 RepID=A0AAV9CUL9_ACOCL|nr:hypothetical protein QJS10_CPB17g01929 [Acorus calamus]